MDQTAKDLKVKIHVQQELFDPAVLSRQLTEGRTDAGALVAFTGLCRDEDGALAALELEHYQGMAERQLEELTQEALRRWPLLALSVTHRYGRILPGEPIVFVGALSSHRGAAFAAAEFLMDFLKTSAPFWKKEHRKDNAPDAWVAAKEEDAMIQGRWRTHS